eukprot:CCRYP_002896-RA/>CCRYP_002896-RA protein AED:0.29 eAED:0.71 QI:0/0/0/1/0/0/2/0/112
MAFMVISSEPHCDELGHVCIRTDCHGVSNGIAPGIQQVARNRDRRFYYVNYLDLEGRRLARQFVRKSTSQVEAANLLWRVITVGATLNLIGLLKSLLGAQYIMGTLVDNAVQ